MAREALQEEEVMAYRNSVKRSKSRRGFRKGARVNRKNFRAGPMRGGIRL